METEMQTIERLIRQGFSNEKLFKMFPTHINYIENYREFLIEQSKPYRPNESDKVYDKPIYFDVDQGITAVRRFGVYARSEEEAIEKVKIGEYEAMDIEVLEADEPYVIDADESEVEIINQ